MIRTTVIVVCLLIANRAAAQAEELVPVSPNATADAKLVLNYLGSLSEPNSPQFLSGQNAGHSNNSGVRAYYPRMVTRLFIETQKFPALLGVDYGFDKVGHGLTDSNEHLIRHWKQGGLVTASMHPPNPWRESKVHDTKLANISDLLTPGTAVHNVWMGTLDRAAAALRDLESEGVVVLWRPLHEMNGDWFWWCAGNERVGFTRHQFVKLWTQTFDYLTERHGLTNLLWVYSPSLKYDEGQRPAKHFYPGDKYVDIVAMDAYVDDLRSLEKFGDYSELAALGKPLGLAEFGPSKKRDGTFDNLTTVRGIKESCPQIGFVLYWHSWSGVRLGIVDNTNANEFMQHDDVITRDEVDWRPSDAAHKD